MPEITVNVKDQFVAPWKKRTMEQLTVSHRVNSEHMLLESHVSMFEYGNLPDTVNPFFIEFYLQCHTLVGWYDIPDYGLAVCEASIADDLDPYGIGRNVILTTLNGGDYTARRGEDCVIGFNNLTMTPCDDIFADAQTLAEIQTSIDYLIFWTRLSPLVRATDEKAKNEVITAFKNIQRGIPATIVSKKILSEFNIPEEISVEQLTQPDFADKIQYTAKLYDDVLRWHYTRYGHATNGNSKAAQQTVDEVDSTASQSMILPLSMLRARKRMIDEVNDMFGTDITVELSGAWRAEVTAYENQSGESSIDGTPDDSGVYETDTLSDTDTQAQPDSTSGAPETETETESDKTDTIIDAIEDAAETIADAIKEEGSDNEPV